MDPDELKEQFIRWQCRIRQYSVRKDRGRPSQGMRPRLLVKGQDAGAATVMMVKSDSADVTREFRFIYQRTQDAADRYQQAVKLLSEYYYQIPAEFSEELAAVYPLDSAFADRVVQAGESRLVFEQGNQRYDILCRTRDIPRADPKYEAVYWHNRLFNSNLPGVVKILGFAPVWEASGFFHLDQPGCR